jgi:predicted Zn-dependent peptidase
MDAVAPATAGPPLADEAFRASAPAAEPGAPFVPPATRELALPNGMRVVLVERHDLPLVALQLLVPHGTDDARARVGSFAMETLLRGNRDRSGRTARKGLDALAVNASPWGAPDSIGVRVTCVRDKLRPALAILSAALARPTLEAKDIETVRTELLAGFEKEKGSVGTVQQWAIREALYPAGHPYREVLVDRAADLRAVTRADITRFVASHLTPNGMTVIAAGDITPAELETELTDAFGGWKGSPASRPPAPVAAPRPKPGAPRVFLVDRPSASQTHVAIVAASLARSSEDYVPAMVFNRILGGTVSSRLGKNLREEKGLTYWVSSTISTRHGAGELTAGGAAVREKSGIAVREILREIERLVTDPVSERELTDATEGLARELPARFEALGGILWSYGEAPVHGLPPDELRMRASRFAKVTGEDVRRIAKTYFERDALRIVVTGDASVVRKDLEGLDLGPVQSLEPAGVR